ncbi:hypothetical protein [Kribbella sp. NPDC049584]|uniref:hypothetical protein n=1 Tax=Kribbella sp. NPDC049584 TaxID=3154833 RepID=UPI00342CE896
MNERYDETSRRKLLQAGALGAGAVFTSGALSAGNAAATGTGETGGASATAASSKEAGRIDTEHPRFTLAIVPDTQYQFDQDRGDPAPLTATFNWLIDNRTDENIVFMAHLGDVTENALAMEFAQADPVFKILDRARFPYSVLAGNHDIDGSKDDTRGPSPYLDTFSPRRFRWMPTYGGSTANGYNSYHVFRAGGRQWLLLAMDWRPSDASFA